MIGYGSGSCSEKNPFRICDPGENAELKVSVKC
jgi:hypothetical protein